MADFYPLPRPNEPPYIMEEIMQETIVQRLIEVKQNQSGYVAAIRVGSNRIRYAMAEQQQSAIELLIYKVKG